MNIYYRNDGFEIEKIEDGYACLLDDSICFLNQTAYEIWEVCHGKDVYSICAALQKKPSFTDDTISKEIICADIAEALKALAQNGLVREEAL